MNKRDNKIGENDFLQRRKRQLEEEKKNRVRNIPKDKKGPDQIIDVARSRTAQVDAETNEIDFSNGIARFDVVLSKDSGRMWTGRVIPGDVEITAPGEKFFPLVYQFSLKKLATLLHGREAPCIEQIQFEGAAVQFQRELTVTLKMSPTGRGGWRATADNYSGEMFGDSPEEARTNACRMACEYLANDFGRGYRAFVSRILFVSKYDKGPFTF